MSYRAIVEVKWYYTCKSKEEAEEKIKEIVAKIGSWYSEIHTTVRYVPDPIWTKKNHTGGNRNE